MTKAKLKATSVHRKSRAGGVLKYLRDNPATTCGSTVPKGPPWDSLFAPAKLKRETK